MSRSASTGFKSKRISCFEMAEQEQNVSNNVKLALGLPDVGTNCRRDNSCGIYEQQSQLRGCHRLSLEASRDCGVAEERTQRHGEGTGMLD